MSPSEVIDCRRRFGRLSDSLSGADTINEDDLIDLHSRTGRLLGCTDFVSKLEAITGEALTPKRAGRKPVTGK